MHEPPGYACPFCRLLDGVETERNRLDDVVSRGERTTAFVSPKWWPANPGAAIVIPNAHVENLYEVDDDLLGDELYGLQAQSRWVAPEERAGYSAQLRAVLGRVCLVSGTCLTHVTATEVRELRNAVPAIRPGMRNRALPESRLEPGYAGRVTGSRAAAQRRSTESDTSQTRVRLVVLRPALR